MERLSDEEVRQAASYPTDPSRVVIGDGEAVVWRRHLMLVALAREVQAHRARLAQPEAEREVIVCRSCARAEGCEAAVEAAIEGLGVAVLREAGFKVPPGVRVEEFVVTGREVVVLGSPAESDDEESGHNCDAMGCGGCHVLYRHPLLPAPPPDGRKG